jgi:3-hydroxyisobutyrate dehydrogenase
MSAPMKIAFIGLGNMGGPMARNLIKHGHHLTVFDIVPEYVQRLTEMGATARTTPAAAARGADVVVTMLPASVHVRSVYTGANGVLEGADAGTLLIDSSTIDPHTAREVAAAAAAKGLVLLDAPVSGGTGGAEAGTLTFMVGGEAAEFERARPILACMGKNIVHCGGSGTGQVAKVCNNMVLGISMIAVSEAMSLAESLGMQPKIMAGILNTSSGRCWSSDTYNPMPGVMENVPASRGYTGGFGSDLMLKDLGLAVDAARAAKQPVVLGGIAEQIYRKHSFDGHGAKDFSSVIAQYRIDER